MNLDDLVQRSGAIFGPLGEEADPHRYLLSRIWNVSLPVVMFVGLNPSIAGAKVDDPTIRREVGFAKSWGYGGLLKANLYALRSTNPNGLLTAADPIGPLNDDWMTLAVRHERVGRVVCAWGSHFQKRPRKGGFTAADRAIVVADLLWGRGGKGLYCIGVPSVVAPKLPPHPLYLAASLMPVRWAR